jgi:hypothetical protein
MIAASESIPSNSIQELQAKFLNLLPRIKTHATICFRFITCPDRRADRIAETVALAWKWHVRLHQRGKDASKFPTAFVTLVAKSVRSGRNLCGQEKANDVMSPLAQRRRKFTVKSLSTSARASLDVLQPLSHGQDWRDAFEERLKDNVHSPVPDQAAFRIDWPTFCRTLSHRDQRLAKFLSMGHPAKSAADEFGLSQGRVTQLRQQWCREWRACQAGDEDTDQLAPETGQRSKGRCVTSFPGI